MDDKLLWPAVHGAPTDLHVRRLNDLHVRLLWVEAILQYNATFGSLIIPSGLPSPKIIDSAGKLS